jgi:hypothetical protein
VGQRKEGKFALQYLLRRGSRLYFLLAILLDERPLDRVVRPLVYVASSVVIDWRGHFALSTYSGTS